MSIPLLIDSDDCDSLGLSSDETILENYEEPEIRVCADINPDDINLDLYEITDEEEDEEPPAPIVKELQKPRTLHETEQQLISTCCSGGNIFQTLYLLHEHFSQSSNYTMTDKNSIKYRIMEQVRGKVTTKREAEIKTILENFFR